MVIILLLMLTAIAFLIVRWCGSVPGRYRARLLRPEFDEPARVMGYSLEPQLRQLYDDPSLVLRENFEWVDTGRQPPKRWDVGGFLPADLFTAWLPYPTDHPEYVLLVFYLLGTVDTFTSLYNRERLFRLFPDSDTVN